MSSNHFLNQIQQISLKTSEEKVTPKELLFKFISFLPFFIISIILCLSVATSVLRYKDPVFFSSTRLLIKNNSDNKPSFSSQAGGDLIETALFSNNQINLENEIMAIRSTRLIQKVVDSFHFNYEYLNEGTFRNSELYGNVPFAFESIKWKDSSSYFHLYIYDISAEGGMIKSTKESSDTLSFKWNSDISFNGNQFRLTSKFNRVGKENYFFIYEPPYNTANKILSNLVIYPNNSRATILQIDLKGANLLKISTILDLIVNEYAKQALNDKNLVIYNTINFINQRLDIVSKELSKVEDGLTAFKQNNKFIDISSNTSDIVAKKKSFEQDILSLTLQEQAVQLFSQQLKSLKSLQLLNTDIGLYSTFLSNLVLQYNSLVLKKQKEEPNVGKNSSFLLDLNSQIKNSYNSILQGVEDFKKNISLQKQIVNKRLSDQQNLFTQVPQTEQKMVEIKRQQNIKEGLYLYLLQKREETAITTSSHSSNYQQLELANGYKIEPVPQKIYMYALFLGIFIPIGYIFIVDLFNDKIQSRNDIIRKTKIPIIADIGHAYNSNLHLIVADQSRNVIAEQFRILRTNLNFLIQDKKTILVTSSMSGEGKSFVALNLAAVFAISSKKVALLEFDLRKPRIIKNIGATKRKIGLSNYLAKQTDSLDDLFYTLDNYPSLHIYGCGPIPPNPAELMTGDRIEQLFEQLKAKYDYIIVDTAPVGLVSDGFNIMKLVDNTIYVIRQRKTLKKQLDFINDCFINNQLKNVGIVLNDVKVGPRHSYYGYNYSYGYGYAYGYSRKGEGEYFDIEKSSGFFKNMVNKIRKN